MSLLQSATQEFEDKELNDLPSSGISCDRLRQALKKCIKESDCVQIQARSARECIDAHDGSVPDKCFSLLQNFIDCKKSMLELGTNYVAFEPETLRNGQSGNTTQNFFDDVNLKICTVRNNGSLGITAKSLANDDVISARTKDRGPPGLMKLSPNGKLAILQRQKNSVDIVMLEKNDDTAAVEFNVPTKSKDLILSVDWVTNNQILFVTKQSLELFSLNEGKGTAKLLRSLNISASWSIYYAKSNLVVLAMGNNCSTLQPLLVQYSQFTRLKSFDVDFCTSACDSLLEKDVTICSIYGKICVLVLRYNNYGSLVTDLLIYELLEDTNCTAKMKYSLALGCSGGFGIHVIDNLIIVHHQGSAKSMIFDVAISPSRVSYSPLITLSIKPSPICQPPPALYVPLWSMFQPDIIVDPVVGMMYQLTVACHRAHEEISDKVFSQCLLIEFLINRTNQKALVLNTLLTCLREKTLRLRHIRRVFNLIVKKFTLSSAAGSSHIDSTKPHLIATSVEHLRIEQREMHSAEDSSDDPKFIANMLLQYLRSLQSMEVPVEDYLLELVIESLALSGELVKLHQLAKYKVIPHSKPMAFLLISYEARCPPLFQSGVDILARQKACEEVVEILLERGNVIDAIRYLDVQQIDTNIWKLLDSAKRQDRVVQYSVLTNLMNRKNKSWWLNQANGFFVEPDNISKFENELATLYTEEEVKKAIDEMSKES
ncbi:putative colon cancer-associated protein Mic1 [Dictyocaulus viviparus]|uniref:Putative colon cancer-associated protein Mic1 n=1 Tax=Dictyocaulus viviparus TaxID=29172 RepID=A0A0D8XXS8_DICVI|nr:putative colon cancer-associated protein Mic1 [Dictyocaulus viviparus]